MKKLIILLFLILLTGCSHKETLICTKNSTSEKQTLTFKYIDNVLDTGQIKYVFNVNKDELSNAKEEIEDTFKDNFQDFKISISDNNKDTIIVILEINQDNISKIVGTNINSNSLESLKTNLEQASFTCN